MNKTKRQWWAGSKGQKCIAILGLTFAALSAAQSTLAQSYTGLDLYILSPPLPAAISFDTASASSGQVVGTSGTIAMTGMQHAILWNGSGEPVDLTPTASGSNGASATDGAHQVGQAGGHAMLWSGTPESAVDLHPTGLSEFTYSIANGVHGDQQVGDGIAINTNQTINFYHALLWNGSAGSVVDLNPASFDDSAAVATDGIYQVGYGAGSGTSGNGHALLWNGTANSAIDLNPTNLGYASSGAFGVGGVQQVGTGARADGSGSALLWSGTADSAVNLQPASLSGVTITDAFAYGTNGVHQVGSVAGDFFHHAVAWSGTADSAMDLNPLLPFSSWISDAFSINAQGDIFGVALDSDANYHAVEWLAVPEPSTFLLAAVTIAMICAFLVLLNPH
jgi:hypothetical protein